MRTFRDAMGRVMVEEPAGGTGGSPITSMATRPATDAEIMSFHVEEVANAKAAMEAAEAAHKEAVDAHAKHVALQPPAIGAPPPPGPLDHSSVVAQGVGDPGPDDPHGMLGTPLGGHTEDQGQPTQPVEHGMRPPSPPAATMPSAPEPVKPSGPGA